MRNKQQVIIGLLIIAVIGIPSIVFLSNQQQEIRGRAEKSATLLFSPTSSDITPLQTQVGNILPLEIILNPGTNPVSQVKLDLIYDPAKFEITAASSFETNLTAFAQVVEVSMVSPGKMTVNLSIGPDLTKVIQQVTRVGTLKLKALSSTTVNEAPTSVTLGPNTQILAIGTNDPNENVLSSTQPAIISIGQPVLPTCSPKPSCLDATPQCLIPEPAGGWCPAPTPTSAPTPTTIPQPTQCKNASTDTVLIIDRSGSMQGTKFTKAKEAAKLFIDKVASDPNNRIALVSFETNAVLVSSFTNDFNLVKNKIDGLTIGNGTCIQCGVNKANAEISASGRAGYKKVAILLTDGKANKIDGKTASTSSAESAAIEAVKTGFNSSKTVFYTIGLGSDVSSNFLTQIAALSGGKYYSSPAELQLIEIYTQISQVFAKGSVSGYVFNDANNNGAFDQNESKLSGWTLNLQSSSGANQPFTSDGTGTYNISSLCDGSYILKETLKPGWTQTKPTNPIEYPITITGGSAVVDKIFGNYQVPAPTPTPVSTTLLLNGLIDGIGARGDNSNPDGNFSNKKPLHETRNLIVNIFNASNQLVASSATTMNYSSQSGMFVGKAVITQPFTSGAYTIKTVTENHLSRLLAGIQNLTAGKDNQLPNAVFIAGDVLHDNQLDIRDYNSLIDCYSDLLPATACTDLQKKNASDLNDDGSVNQFDYNLFLREIATQPGQ